MNLAITDKDLREQLLTSVIREDGEEKTTYLGFLRVVEQKQEFKSITELHKKI